VGRGFAVSLLLKDADIPQVAVGTAVLDGDDELLGKKRREDAYVALFICLRPFLFKRDDLVADGRSLVATVTLFPVSGKRPARIFLARIVSLSHNICYLS